MCKLKFAPTLLTVVIAVLVQVTVTAVWIEFDLVKILNSNTGQFQTDFHVKRIKNIISMDGEFWFFQDYDDNFDCEARISYSAIGNNQFKAMPYKLAKDNCCIILDTSFWGAFHAELEKASELNIDKNRPTCYSYKKGNYTLRDFYFNKDALPKYLAPGTYKMEIINYRRNSTKLDSNFGFMFKLY